MKLDNTTHIPDYGSDTDSDDDAGVEVVSSVLADAGTISDVTNKMHDVKSIMEYNGKQINGLLR